VSTRLSRFIGRVEVSHRQNRPALLCGLNHPFPRVIGDSPPSQPPVDRVFLLVQGGRHLGNVCPDRKYVVKGLHRPDIVTDYLSVQERTEKQVTPLFKQLTMLPMKGQRKPSTPSQWRDEFIARVRSARIVSGKKPVEVAAYLGVSLDTYNRWETRALLPHHLVMPFCTFVGADPVMLLTGRPFDLGKALASPSRRA
jgi:hypothetical protein